MALLYYDWFITNEQRTEQHTDLKFPMTKFI